MENMQDVLRQFSDESLIDEELPKAGELFFGPRYNECFMTEIRLGDEDFVDKKSHRPQWRGLFVRRDNYSELRQAIGSSFPMSIILKPGRVDLYALEPRAAAMVNALLLDNLLIVPFKLHSDGSVKRTDHLRFLSGIYSWERPNTNVRRKAPLLVVDIFINGAEVAGNLGMRYEDLCNRWGSRMFERKVNDLVDRTSCFAKELAEMVKEFDRKNTEDAKCACII